ncbi:hypothetical protein FA15DRAFT_68502 [Coprinopsis marcescibilis]|uniref:F-box domain-containing protein n=1 Tax=Coprinopsis marcescibilis TaxID=230819 RepID=A0A5C3KMS5_COPMA|nr:hypothetical protein FA15DRAFT_68502 [Coprinopsis marcescibilis]
MLCRSKPNLHVQRWTLPLPMLELPSELVRRILDLLDQSSLKQTSLVCSALCGPCQELIFATLTLEHKAGCADPPAHGQALITRYRQNPAIAGYVKHLVICETKWLRRPSHDSWLARDDKFPEAVDLLSLDKLQSFYLDLGRTDLNQLPEGVKSAVRKICCSPSLTKLELLGAPLSLIDGCSAYLQTLCLRNVHICPTAGSWRKAAPVHLHYLDIATSNPQGVITHIVDRLLDPDNNINTTRLVFLHANLDIRHSLHYNTLNRLIATCAETLRTLSLHLEHNMERCDIDHDANIDIGSCRFLTEISISFTMIYSVHGLKRVLSEVLRIFETLSLGNQIETIRLDAHFLGVMGAEFNEESLGYKQWGLLDTLLSNRERFGRLRKIELDVSDNSRINPLDEPVAKRFENCMKALISAGTLEVKYSQGPQLLG